MYLVVRLEFWGSAKYGVTRSLPLLPASLCPGMVVLVRFPSIGQMDLFKIMFKMIFNYINTLTLEVKYEVSAFSK